jgi:predicted component of type VI protein secretion system
MRRLLRTIARAFARTEPSPAVPRVIPPSWASDDDLALLRKAGLL